MQKMQSFLKWSGSKRIQSDWILSMFPKFSGRYVEPFLGSGIILLSCLKRHPNAECIANDLCSPLVCLWNACRDRPMELAKDYREMWNEFNSKDIQWRKDYFNSVRSEFNADQTRSSHFLFLTRTSINGLARFNSSGLYNAPVHFSRPGIDPTRLKCILEECSSLIQGTSFTCKSFSEIELHPNDFCYMDPPYAGTGKGMYFGGFDAKRFYEFVEHIPCKWLMSYNGIVNGSAAAELPRHLYADRAYTALSNSSSFNAIHGAVKAKRKVQESLYANFVLPVCSETDVEKFF